MWRRRDREGEHRDRPGHNHDGHAGQRGKEESTSEINEACNALAPAFANRPSTAASSSDAHAATALLETKLDAVILALQKTSPKIGSDAAGDAIFKVAQAFEGKLKGQAPPPSSSSGTTSATAATAATTGPSALDSTAATFSSSSKALAKALYVVHALCKAQDISVSVRRLDPIVEFLTASVVLATKTAANSLQAFLAATTAATTAGGTASKGSASSSSSNTSSKPQPETNASGSHHHLLMTMVQALSISTLSLRSLGYLAYACAEKLTLGTSTPGGLQQKIADACLMVMTGKLPSANINIITTAPSSSSSSSSSSLSSNPSSASLSPATLLAAQTFPLQAAAVVLANLVTRSGTKLKLQLSALVAPAARVLLWASSAPAPKTVEEADRGARTLSAYLRLLSAVISAAGTTTGTTTSTTGSSSSSSGGSSSSSEATREALSRCGEDLVRGLRPCFTFCWALETSQAALHATAVAAAAATAAAQGQGASASASASSSSSHGGFGPSTSLPSSSSASWYTDSSSDEEEDDDDENDEKSSGRRGKGRGRGGERGFDDDEDDGDDDDARDAMDDDDEDDGAGNAEKNRGTNVKQPSRHDEPKTKSRKSKAGDDAEDAEETKLFAALGAGILGGASASAATPAKAAAAAGGVGSASVRSFGSKEKPVTGTGAGAASVAAKSAAVSLVAPKPRRLALRVRVTSLHCLASLARSQPRLVQARWLTFVPEVHGTHPKPFSPSLLTVLLYDRSARVREASAAALQALLLEAPLEKWVAPDAAGITTTANAAALVGNAPGGGAGVAGAGTAGNEAAAFSSSSSSSSSSSMSERFAASCHELHLAVIRALTSKDASRRPAFLASCLGAVAVMLAGTPYTRLKKGASVLTPLLAALASILTPPATVPAPAAPPAAPPATSASTSPSASTSAVATRRLYQHPHHHHQQQQQQQQQHSSKAQAGQQLPPHVLAAAMNACCSVFSNPSALACLATAAATATAVALAAGAGATASDSHPLTTMPSVFRLTQAADNNNSNSPLRRLLLSLCTLAMPASTLQKSREEEEAALFGGPTASAAVVAAAAAASTVRLEALGSLGKIARAAPILAAQLWSPSPSSSASLSPATTTAAAAVASPPPLQAAVLASFADQAGPTRKAGLRILSELLRAREEVLQPLTIALSTTSAVAANASSLAAASGGPSSSSSSSSPWPFGSFSATFSGSGTAYGGLGVVVGGHNRSRSGSRSRAASSSRAAGRLGTTTGGSSIVGAAKKKISERLKASTLPKAVAALSLNDDDDDEDGEGEATSLSGKGPQQQTKKKASVVAFADGPSSANEKTKEELAEERLQQQEEAVRRFWLDFARAADSSGSEPQLSLSLALRTVLPRALRDPVPAVRAEALSCFSYLLPCDWHQGLLASSSSLPLDQAVKLRNDILLLVANAACSDTSAVVRVASCRLWAVYPLYPQWRCSKAFGVLAARVLLTLLRDESVAVRAKASWALGCLCAPFVLTSSSSSSSSSSSASSSSSLASETSASASTGNAAATTIIAAAASIMPHGLPNASAAAAGMNVSGGGGGGVLGVAGSRGRSGARKDGTTATTGTPSKVMATTAIAESSTKASSTDNPASLLGLFAPLYPFLEETGASPAGFKPVVPPATLWIEKEETNAADKIAPETSAAAKGNDKDAVVLVPAFLVRPTPPMALMNRPNEMVPASSSSSSAVSSHPPAAAAAAAAAVTTVAEAEKRLLDTLLSEAPSQSALVNLLSLPLLRLVARQNLHAAGLDLDKVACTAVRTLGFAVQALLLHWLPLPASIRHAVNPVVHTVPAQALPQQTCVVGVSGIAPSAALSPLPAASSSSSSSSSASSASASAPPQATSAPAPAIIGKGSSSSSFSSSSSTVVFTVRPRPLFCPDDPLIKSCMLLLAELVAGGAGKEMMLESPNPSSSASAATAKPTLPMMMATVAGTTSNGTNAKTTPAAASSGPLSSSIPPQSPSGAASAGNRTPSDRPGLASSSAMRAATELALAHSPPGSNHASPRRGPFFPPTMNKAAVPLPSKSKEEEEELDEDGDAEDVRAIIMRRAQAPALQRLLKLQKKEEEQGGGAGAAGGNDDDDDEELSGEATTATTAKAKPLPTVVVPPPVPAVPTAPPAPAPAPAVASGPPKRGPLLSFSRAKPAATPAAAAAPVPAPAPAAATTTTSAALPSRVRPTAASASATAVAAVASAPPLPPAQQKPPQQHQHQHAAQQAPPSVKVRWNACHAVCGILPLAHRVVTTHDADSETGLFAATLASSSFASSHDAAGGAAGAASSLPSSWIDDGSSSGAAAAGGTAGLAPSQRSAARRQLTQMLLMQEKEKEKQLLMRQQREGRSSSPSAAAAAEEERTEARGAAAADNDSSSPPASSSKGLSLASLRANGEGSSPPASSSSTDAASAAAAAAVVHSPPRPKVRRDVVSGASTMLAGVEHLSTARSPFLRQQQGTTGAGVVAASPAAGSSVASAAPGSASGLRSVASPESGGFSASSSSSSAAVASGDVASGGSSGGGSGSVGGSSGGPLVRIVTDPTHPSVTLGATWLPPVLASLQVALTASSNLKVRIAAAHGLSTVPSRESYRIPLPLSLSATVGASAVAPSLALPPTSSSSSSTAAAAAAAAAALTSGPSTASDVSAPHLQQPGFDAFPSALISLITALEQAEASTFFSFSLPSAGGVAEASGGGRGTAGAGAGDDASASASTSTAVALAAAAELTRYRPPLQGAVRLGLVHMLSLAEKLDYGKVKPFLDAKAPLLYDWLFAEATLFLPPSSFGNYSAGPTTGEGAAASATAASSAAASAVATAATAPPSSPARGSGSGIAAAAAAPAVDLQPSTRVKLAMVQPGIDLAVVSSTLQALTKLFASRVKSIPPPLLRKYQALSARVVEAVEKGEGQEMQMQITTTGE